MPGLWTALCGHGARGIALAHNVRARRSRGRASGSRARGRDGYARNPGWWTVNADGTVAIGS